MEIEIGASFAFEQIDLTSGTSPSTVGQPLYWNWVTLIVSFILKLVTLNSRRV